MKVDLYVKGPSGYSSLNFNGTVIRFVKVFNFPPWEPEPNYYIFELYSTGFISENHFAECAKDSILYLSYGKDREDYVFKLMTGSSTFNLATSYMQTTDKGTDLKVCFQLVKHKNSEQWVEYMLFRLFKGAVE